MLWQPIRIVALSSSHSKTLLSLQYVLAEILLTTKCQESVLASEISQNIIAEYFPLVSRILQDKEPIVD